MKAYDPVWPDHYLAEQSRIRGALAARALAIEHVGSTAVPGLSAKDRLDIDLIVADPADEAAYVPALEAVGYALRARDPDWYQHRAGGVLAAGVAALRKAEVQNDLDGTEPVGELVDEQP